MKSRNACLAAALATAFAGAAQAADDTVIYGLAMPFLENVKTSGATSAAPGDKPSLLPGSAYTGLNDAARVRMSVGTSQLGFRGSETLGANLKVVWQLESAFQIDQNTGPGWGARNSKIGLVNPVWGEVLMGQWDTPYKFTSLPMNPWRAGYVFDYTGIMGNPGMGVPATTTQQGRVGGKPDAAFDKRAGNSIQWWSPKWGGFSARLGWSVNEGRTSDGPGVVSISPQIWSAALMYDRGSLSLRYAYEQHDDYFGLSALSSAGSSAAGTTANRSSKDTAHKVVALYRIGNTRLAGSYEQLKYTNDDSLAGAFKEFKRNAYYVTGEQFFGAQSVWAAYGRADDGSCSKVGGASCSTRNQGADFWALGWIYRFSKRTELFVTYYKLANKESGTYSPQPVVGASIAPGADTEGYGVGLIHYF